MHGFSSSVADDLERGGLELRRDALDILVVEDSHVGVLVAAADLLPLGLRHPVVRFLFRPNIHPGMQD